MKRFAVILCTLLVSVGALSVCCFASSGAPFDPLLPAFPSGLNSNVYYKPHSFYGDRIYFLTQDRTQVYQLPSTVTWTAEKVVDPQDSLDVSAKYEFHVSGFLPIDGSYQEPTVICVLFPSDVLGLMNLTDQWSVDGLTIEFSHDLGYFTFQQSDTLGSALSPAFYHFKYVTHRGVESALDAELPAGTFYMVRYYLTVFGADSATDSIDFTLTVQSPYFDAEKYTISPEDAGAPSFSEFLRILSEFFLMFKPVLECTPAIAVGSLVAAGIVFGLVCKLVL